ncbi:uncharacterized protein V1516DRAFT_667480 [Lipomyces oligophaga]|uniref:uncharacterized protein n=1 Tax=Lipomyces oligophaga TaxID=45792 RepID=UPI0034CD3F22
MSVILPGDSLPLQEVLPPKSSPTIQLGPGLLHVPPSTIVPIRSGILRSNPTSRSTTLYLDSVPSSSGRYIPALHDVVIGTVHSRFGDQESQFYRISLPNCSSPIAILPSTAFANAASRKNRPNLIPGATVYGRISFASPRSITEPELACFDERSGLDGGFGELKGGMLADIPISLARSLLLPRSSKSKQMKIQESVVDIIGKSVPFEIALGRNGRMWVDSDSIQATVAIITAIKQTENMTIEQTRQKVGEILATIKR